MQDREGRRNLPPPDRCSPRFSRRGAHQTHPQEGRSSPEGLWSVQLYGRQVVLIVPEVVSLCQLDPVRFTPVQARRSSRVTGSAYRSPSFFRSVPEVGFPVGSYKHGAFEAVSSAPAATSAARLVHPLPDFINNSVDGGVREGAVPCDGTGSKISARRAGAPGGIGVRRPLSTGVPLQGRLVDDESRVLPAPIGGVRFGVYTGPMNTQTMLEGPALAVSAALVGAVGR